jgi:hypothetical protein
MRQFRSWFGHAHSNVRASATRKKGAGVWSKAGFQWEHIQGERSPVPMIGFFPSQGCWTTMICVSSSSVALGRASHTQTGIGRRQRSQCGLPLVLVSSHSDSGDVACSNASTANPGEHQNIMIKASYQTGLRYRDPFSKRHEISGAHIHN